MRPSLTGGQSVEIDSEPAVDSYAFRSDVDELYPKLGVR